MINQINLSEVKKHFIGFLTSLSIDQQMYELIDIEDSTVNNESAIRLDLFMVNFSSRFIVFETGDASIEVIDSKTNEDIVFDNFEKLNQDEIKTIFEKTIEKYHCGTYGAL
jgi:hypothetical protein